MSEGMSKERSKRGRTVRQEVSETRSMEGMSEGYRGVSKECLTVSEAGE